MVVDIDYRKFSNRVCNWREAGFIAIGFTVAVAVVAAILLGIYFGTKCADGERACNDGTTCVRHEKFCNGIHDCPIGEDEWKCHPSEFYVSFWTNQNFSSELESDASEMFNTTRTVYEKAISEALKTQDVSNVTVFRFRGVDQNGVKDMGNDLAVDSLIKFKNGTAATKEHPFFVHPDNISLAIQNGLTMYDAVIHPRSAAANVTTGIAVVLRAPEGANCRVKANFCPNFCPDTDDKPFYQYGTTKGCPECVCIKDY